MCAQSLLEPVHAVNHGLDGGVIQNGNVALASGNLSHQFSSLDAARVVVGGNVRSHVNTIGGDVNRDDRNTSGLRLQYGGLHALGINWGQNDGVDLSADEVFDVRNLFVQVLVRDAQIQFGIVLRCLLLHRVCKLDVERVLLGQQRCANGVFLGEGGGSGSAKAGCNKSLEKTIAVHGISLGWCGPFVTVSV